MIDDDNDGQIIFEDFGGLKLPDICVTGEEKPRNKLTQETYPDRGSNPGCMTGAHATSWPTAVDSYPGHVPVHNRINLLSHPF